MVDEKDIVAILNDLLKKDESAMVALLSLTVPTTHAVLKDYDVRFGSRSSDYPQLGIITIINKIIEKGGTFECKKVEELKLIDVDTSKDIERARQVI